RAPGDRPGPGVGRGVLRRGLRDGRRLPGAGRAPGTDPGARGLGRPGERPVPRRVARAGPPGLADGAPRADTGGRGLRGVEAGWWRRPAVWRAADRRGRRGDPGARLARPVHLLDQRPGVVRPRMALPPHEEGRGAPSSTRLRAGDVLPDAVCQVLPLQVTHELLDIEAELGGIPDEVLHLQLVLPGEEQ